MLIRPPRRLSEHFQSIERAGIFLTGGEQERIVGQCCSDWPTIEMSGFDKRALTKRYTAASALTVPLDDRISPLEVLLNDISGLVCGELLIFHRNQQFATYRFGVQFARARPLQLSTPP